MTGAFNVEHCVQYLRHTGIEITAETEVAWEAQQKSERARRRAHKRELKRSCGHFRTHWTDVYHPGGLTRIRYCNDCRKGIEFRGAGFGGGVA